MPHGHHHPHAPVADGGKALIPATLPSGPTPGSSLNRLQSDMHHFHDAFGFGDVLDLGETRFKIQYFFNTLNRASSDSPRSWGGQATPTHGAYPHRARFNEGADMTLTVTSRTLWILIALISAALATASLVLTLLLDLDPCHLSIFQRLLFMILALLAALTATLQQPGRPLFAARLT
jgi:hypothetical protein